MTLNIQQSHVNDTLKSSVKGIFVDFEIKRNQDNRKSALQRSYLIGFKRYLDWITTEPENILEDIIQSIDVSSLVTSYSIANEKFNEERYSALITVNYDIEKIDTLLRKKKLKYFAGIGPKILVLPLMSFNDQLILWDDPNPWFEAWIERPIDGNLTEFIIPEGDVNDLITISAEDTRELSFSKIRNIALKYNVKKVMVPFLTIVKKDEKYYLSLRCFDGLSKEILNVEITKEINESNFDLALFETLNSFTSFYDDYWVADNIKKIESQVLVEVNIMYDSFRDWTYIKKTINNSKNVKSFKVLSLSTNESLSEIKLINTKQFISELENNNISMKKKNNIWNIKKYF